ncbi:hypothetical protein PMAYCL1PPCAC_09268, partial [Pristionchus mayeri]
FPHYNKTIHLNMNVSWKDSTLFFPLEISCFIHFPALSCLLRVTPPNQAEIKTNLVIVQICVILIDVLDSLLFEPLFVAEELLVYCRGPASHAVAVPVALGSILFAIGALIISTFTCIAIRHQTMIPKTNRFKMRKVIFKIRKK